MKEVIAELKSMGDPESVAGMARYGITSERALGVSIPKLQALAKKVGRNHRMAEALWSSALHEARILACMVADPLQLTEAQMERWVKDFDSWDLCDQCCNRLFRKTRFARQKALAWPQRSEEFVKRNLSLNRKAIAVAEEVQLLESRAARWVARDALRELRSEKVQRRLIQKDGR